MSSYSPHFAVYRLSPMYIIINPIIHNRNKWTDRYRMRPTEGHSNDNKPISIRIISQIHQNLNPIVSTVLPLHNTLLRVRDNGLGHLYLWQNGPLEWRQRCLVPSAIRELVKMLFRLTTKKSSKLCMPNPFYCESTGRPMESVSPAWRHMQKMNKRYDLCPGRYIFIDSIDLIHVW